MQAVSRISRSERRGEELTLKPAILPYLESGLQKLLSGVPLIQIIASIPPTCLRLMASGCAAVQLDLHSLDEAVPLQNKRRRRGVGVW